MGYNAVVKELGKHKDAEKARVLQRFFKTGKGEYGEGDVFLGVSVPVQRKVAGMYWRDCSLSDVQALLDSKFHEHRLTGLFILVKLYEKDKDKKKIVGFYLENTERVNNWDLVDSSAHKIIGDYLVGRDRKVLYKLLKSRYLWERRISVISCFAFIARNDFKDALRICELLLKDEHDLIHKATGWMLREIGKRDLKVLEGFLVKHHKVMPRTMLRYSIERLSEQKRKRLLG